MAESGKAKRKLWIYAAAALVILCLLGWVVMLYAEKGRREDAWEKEFLMRYSAALNDLGSDLGHFEEADSFEEQLSGLGAVANDLMQLKAFMELHVNLMVSGTDKAVLQIEPTGWKEAERAARYFGGGPGDFYQREPFGADGAISEEEMAIIRFLREETERLYHDIWHHDAEAQGEGGVSDMYALSSAEVYQRLTEILQKLKGKMTE